MTKILILIPATENENLTSISLALTQAFRDHGIKSSRFQLIDQKNVAKEILNPYSISQKHANYLISHGQNDELLEEIVAIYEQKFAAENDIVVVEALSYQADQPLIFKLNIEIANALSANIIILGSASETKNKKELETRINSIAFNLDGKDNDRIMGYIINQSKTWRRLPIESSFSHLISIPKTMDSNQIAKQFPRYFLLDIFHKALEPKITPSRFRYNLIKSAQTANKVIVLPESSDLRVLKAASICAQKKIARIVLLGDDGQEIKNLTKKNNIDLPEEISILNPKELAPKYVSRLVELRKHKGTTEKVAEEALQDWMTVATMMLESGEIDGIVSGASHTTANTIRPALQIIKTIPNMDIVSSIFFMCLPNQVLIYGDCAVNPNPNAGELAQIAIQSADSAKIFGFNPRIAMVSYSTGNSGSGIDIEKVKTATTIVKTLRPDLIIDGPLQYDAAIDKRVAKIKIPDSPVAGQANLFIFPDLNTGNALYKAVQRSANILCLGPMLQGLNKPVNDLSRGCLVDDIVFTVALTAVQALQFSKLKT
jgi:phosphate acetyltransferase